MSENNTPETTPDTAPSEVGSYDEVYHKLMRQQKELEYARQVLAAAVPPQTYVNTVTAPEHLNTHDLFDFGYAIAVLKAGYRVARKGWNGKGMWLALQQPDAESKMTLPYIFMSTAQGDLVPWLASQTDVLATDWQYVDGQVAVNEVRTVTAEEFAKSGYPVAGQQQNRRRGADRRETNIGLLGGDRRQGPRRKA